MLATATQCRLAAAFVFLWAITFILISSFCTVTSETESGIVIQSFGQTGWPLWYRYENRAPRNATWASAVPASHAVVVQKWNLAVALACAAVPALLIVGGLTLRLLRQQNWRPPRALAYRYASSLLAVSALAILIEYLAGPGWLGTNLPSAASRQSIWVDDLLQGGALTILLVTFVLFVPLWLAALRRHLAHRRDAAAAERLLARDHDWPHETTTTWDEAKSDAPRK